MEVIHEYDIETQKLINEIQGHIEFITKQYEEKLQPKTAKTCVELSRPGYEEAIIKEYTEVISSYQKILADIYLKSVPKIIIKS